MDRLPDALIFQLRLAGEEIVDITVKNLAMSSAMALHHQRSKSPEQEAKSKRIRQRCIELLRLLDTHSVKERLEKILLATQGKGDDVHLLKHWKYDDDQKKAIEKGINLVAEN